MGIFSDFIWISAGRLLSALIMLASLRIATTLLSPGQYGILVMLTTFQVFCGLFLVNPVGQYINRHTHEWVSDGTFIARMKHYRTYILLTGCVGAFVTGLWCSINAAPLSKALLQMFLVAFMVVAATWNATWISLLNMIGFRAKSVKWAVVTTFSSLLFSLLLTYKNAEGWSWFAGQAIGMSIGALGSGITLRGQLSGEHLTVRYLIDSKMIQSYCLPLAMATGLMWFLTAGYRIILENYWGLSALGYAAVGFGLASQIWGVTESLAIQFLFPLYYKRISTISENSHLAFSDLLNVIGPIYLILIAAMLVTAAALTKLLIGPAYIHASNFVLIGAFIECCRVLASVLSNAAQIHKRMSVLILPYSAGTISLVIGLVVAWRLHVTFSQAVLALPAAGVVTLITMWVSIFNGISFRLDYPRWLTSLIAIIISGLTCWLFPLTPSSSEKAFGIIISVGVISIAICFGLIYKNEALKRLMSIKLRMGE